MSHISKPHFTLTAPARFPCLPNKTEPLFYILMTGNCSEVFSASRLFTINCFCTAPKEVLMSLLSHNFTYQTGFYYGLWKIRNIRIVGKAPKGKIKLHRLCNNGTDGLKFGRQRHCTCIARVFLTFYHRNYFFLILTHPVYNCE